MKEWFYLRAPDWLVKRGDPDATFMRALLIGAAIVLAIIVLLGVLVMSV